MTLKALTINEHMKTVAIDAGHGGHDGGAYGAYSKEKDVALSVSLLVAEYLKPYVKPFLTRSTDAFLSLSWGSNCAWGASVSGSTKVIRLLSQLGARKITNRK